MCAPDIYFWYPYFYFECVSSKMLVRVQKKNYTAKNITADIKYMKKKISGRKTSPWKTKGINLSCKVVTES